MHITLIKNKKPFSKIIFIKRYSYFSPHLGNLGNINVRVNKEIKVNWKDPIFIYGMVLHVQLEKNFIIVNILFADIHIQTFVCVSYSTGVTA